MKGFTSEEFVAIWQTSETVKEAAERLGCHPRCACARASRYRRAGIPMRTRWTRTPLDIKGLVELAKQHGGTEKDLDTVQLRMAQHRIMPERHVKRATFIRVWNASENASEVARKMGMDGARAACSKAAFLRSKGIKLKIMSSRGQPKTDVKALTKVAKKFKP